MRTSYLDKEIEFLKKGFKNKTNSFYQNRKLSEYIEIKKQLSIQDISNSGPLKKESSRCGKENKECK